MNIVCAQSILAAKHLFASHGQLHIVPDSELNQYDYSDTQAVIIRSNTKIDKGLFDHTPVAFVGTATSGCEHVDVAALKDAGIAFASAAGSNANSVAEYVLAALLTLVEQYDYCLENKCLGIIGYGHVGKQVTAKAQALGLTVLINDPPLAEGNEDFVQTPLDELLAQADIVSLHVPLTKVPVAYPTYKMVDENFIAKMKPSSVLINTARGHILDAEGILSAIGNRHVVHFICDVWPGEPNCDPKLMKAATIATPHIAGHSYPAKVMGSYYIYRAFCQHFNIDEHDDVLQSLLKMENVHNDLLRATQSLPITGSVNQLEVNDTNIKAIIPYIKAVYDISLDHDHFINMLQDSTDLAQQFIHYRKQYAKRWEAAYYQLADQQIDINTKNLLYALGFSHPSQEQQYG